MLILGSYAVNFIHNNSFYIKISHMLRSKRQCNISTLQNDNIYSSAHRLPGSESLIQITRYSSVDELWHGGNKIINILSIKKQNITKKNHPDEILTH